MYNANNNKASFQIKPDKARYGPEMSYPDNSMSQKLLHLTKKTFFLNSKTVVYLGCFKGIKLSLFLIFNLKYKPLFTDFSVPLGASFFLPGSV